MSANRAVNHLRRRNQ